MKHIISLKDEQATLTLGGHLSQIAFPGCIIFLSGELGAGKTTLARGFLSQLGYKGMVKSPTYTLVESYVLNAQIICHFDLYRLEDSKELEMIGVRDYFDGKTICLIEWAERGENVLPSAHIHCHLQVSNDHHLAHIVTQLPELKTAIQDITL